MAVKLTRLTHKIAIQLHLVAEIYHLQFSLQAASPETFGYTHEQHSEPDHIMEYTRWL
jgi:hypothetical protein